MQDQVTSASVAAHSSWALRAVCPAGLLVSGGGYVASDPALVAVGSHAFGDASGQGWEVRVQNSADEAHTLQVDALCLVTAPQGSAAAPSPTPTPAHHDDPVQKR